MNRTGLPFRTRMRSPSFRAKNFSTCTTRSPTARGSSHASQYVMGRCCLLFNGTRSAPRNWTRFAAQYLARGLPCERFTSPLAGRRASLGVGAVGYSLPRGRLSPPILCQLNWRTPFGVKNGPDALEMGCLYCPRKQTSVALHWDWKLQSSSTNGSGQVRKRFKERLPGWRVIYPCRRNRHSFLRRPQ